MPEQSNPLASTEAKEDNTVASTEKAVAKVKIDLKATKVNKKSVEFGNNNNNNNNSVNNQNHQVNSSAVVVPKSDHNTSANETSTRDLSQVSSNFKSKTLHGISRISEFEYIWVLIGTGQFFCFECLWVVKIK